MNIHSKEEVGAAMEGCVNAFDLLREPVTMDGKRPGFIKVIDKRFFVTNKRAHTDSYIIGAISSLLEDALTCPEYMPNQETVKKLREGIQEFIARSKELSTKEKANDIALFYFKEFLLPALDKKVKLAEKVRRWQTEAGSSSSIHKILGEDQIGVFENKKMSHLSSARFHLYTIQKLLDSSLTYHKCHHTIITERSTGIAEGKMRFEVSEPSHPKYCFHLALNLGDLFDEMELLAVRMRTERIVRNDWLKKGNQNALLKHIQTLLDLKHKEPLKAPQVEACLSLLRHWNLTYGDKNTGSATNLRKDSIFWGGVVQKSAEDKRTCDTILTDSHLVGLSMRTVAKIEAIFDTVFLKREIGLFNEGKKESIIDTFVFQHEKRKLFWRLMENCIAQYAKGMEQDAVLYRNIDQKLRASVYKLPPADRNLTMQRPINMIRISVNGEKMPFRDVSPEEYIARKGRISNYAQPVVTQVDALIDFAEGEFQKEQEQKLLSSTKALSIKLDKPLGQPPKKKLTKQKPAKQKQAKQVSVKTDTAANSIIIEVPDASEKGVGKGGRVQRTKTKIAHSPFTYHYRVSRWWSDRNEDNPFLNDPEYTGKGFSQEVQDWIRAKHNFGLTVDRYLKTEGIEYENGQVALIGAITIGEKTWQGLFGYAYSTQNHDKELYYHRFFTETTPNKIIAEYAKQGGYKLDGYAEDQEAQQKPGKGGKKQLADDGSFVQGITDDVITISDPKNKMTIRICRFQQD